MSLGLGFEEVRVRLPSLGRLEALGCGVPSMRLEEIVAHRFVYRPHVTNPVVPHVERRSAEQHLARLQSRGRIQEVEPGRWLA
jgi:hypothetical protein